MNFGVQIWCVILEEMSFETFTPISSHVNENENNLAKIKNFEKPKTRHPWTLVLCLTAADGMTLAIICRLLSKITATE